MSADGRTISSLFRARANLAAVVRSVIKDDATRAKLECLKSEQKQLQKDDFIWEALLGSFSTMGSSRGYEGLILNPENHSRVTFGALSRLSAADRKKVLRQVLHAAKVRMPDKKAGWLARNFDQIMQTGGVVAAKKALLSQPGRDAKMAFLRTFEGIGPKFARNIMMDVYHEDFRESIAVDERIKAITRALGLAFDGYDDEERFYLDVAHDAGLNGWELDRLIYNRKDFIIDGLRSTGRSREA